MKHFLIVILMVGITGCMPSRDTRHVKVMEMLDGEVVNKWEGEGHVYKNIHRDIFDDEISFEIDGIEYHRVSAKGYFETEVTVKR